MKRTGGSNSGGALDLAPLKVVDGASEGTSKINYGTEGSGGQEIVPQNRCGHSSFQSM